jgi:hypothetical protein
MICDWQLAGGDVIFVADLLSGAGNCDLGWVMRPNLKTTADEDK